MAPSHNRRWFLHALFIGCLATSHPTLAQTDSPNFDEWETFTYRYEGIPHVSGQTNTDPPSEYFDAKGYVASDVRTSGTITFKAPSNLNANLALSKSATEPGLLTLWYPDGRFYSNIAPADIGLSFSFTSGDYMVNSADTWRNHVNSSADPIKISTDSTGAIKTWQLGFASVTADERKIYNGKDIAYVGKEVSILSAYGGIWLDGQTVAAYEEGQTIGGVPLTPSTFEYTIEAADYSYTSDYKDVVVGASQHPPYNEIFAYRPQTARSYNSLQVHTDFAFDGSIGPVDHYPWSVPEPTPVEHIIVLTHGWSPGRQFADGSYMQELEDVIRTRLSNDDVDPATVKIINMPWSSAYVPNISALPLNVGDEYYEFSYSGTVLAANELADEITVVLQDAERAGPRPTVHMIGHSLGTVVNALAVNKLMEAGTVDASHPIDRVTILDSPKNPSAIVLSSLGIPETAAGNRVRRIFAADDSLLFYHAMPKGSVQHVENFYGDKSFYNVPNIADPDNRLPAFGQPIAGANPCDGDDCYGYKFAGANHTEVWDIEYGGVVFADKDSKGNEVLWKSPAIQDGSANDVLWRPDLALSRLSEAIGGPGGDLSAFAAYVQIVFLENTPLGSSSGNSGIIDDWHIEAGAGYKSAKGYVLESRSPAALSVMADMDDIYALSFTVDTTLAGEGLFQLLLNDEVVWTTDTVTNGGVLRAIVPTLLEFGRTEITWRYDSDESGSQVSIENLQVLLANVVPEPSSALLLATGIALAHFGYYKKYK